MFKELRPDCYPSKVQDLSLCQWHVWHLKCQRREQWFPVFNRHDPHTGQMLIERYVGLLTDLSERKKRNVGRAKKCGFHCKPLIKDEDSDHWWWDWWLRLEIVRSVKTVWATSPILRFHSSPVDSVSGSSVCRGFVNPRELHHLRSNPISEWGFHLQAPPLRPHGPVSQVMRQTSRVESANQIGFPEGSFEGFFVTNSLFGGDVQSTWYSFRSWRNPVSHKRPLMVRFFNFVEIRCRRRLSKVVFCIFGSCWKPIRTLQFEAQELSSAPLHCCPSISFCQLCSNYVVLHYLFLPPSNSRNFWRPSSL